MSSLPMGDDERGLSVHDAAAKLMERRAERELPPIEAEETIDAEALEQEALGETAETEEVEEVEAVAQEELELDEQTDADEAEAEAFNFQYVEEVAEAAGMNIDEFLSSVKARTKIDGEEGEIPLADLLKGHQLESSFTRKNQAWLEQKAKDEAKIKEERTLLQDHLNNTVAAFQLAQQQLTSDFQNINWQDLEQKDPQQYVLKRQQFGERQAALNAAIQQASTNYQQQQQQQAEKEAEANETRLVEEHEMLMRKIPEWRDSEQTRLTQSREVGDYLRSMGYSDDEINVLSDHRLVLLARAAMGQSGPSKQKLKLAEKKVKQVQNLVKPGAKKPQGSGAQKAAEDATKKARRTGKTSDVAEALLARRKARSQAQARATRRAPQ